MTEHFGPRDGDPFDDFHAQDREGAPGNNAEPEYVPPDGEESVSSILEQSRELRGIPFAGGDEPGLGNRYFSPGLGRVLPATEAAGHITQVTAQHVQRLDPEKNASENPLAFSEPVGVFRAFVPENSKNTIFSRSESGSPLSNGPSAPGAAGRRDRERLLDVNEEEAAKVDMDIARELDRVGEDIPEDERPWKEPENS